MMSSSLRMIIVPLPKGAANVDTYQAKLIQKLIAFAEDNGCLITVLFISYESH